MTKSIAVTPYFERAEGKDDDLAETYVAGLRGARGAKDTRNDNRYGSSIRGMTV